MLKPFPITWLSSTTSPLLSLHRSFAVDPATLFVKKKKSNTPFADANDEGDAMVRKRGLRLFRDAKLEVQVDYLENKGSDGSRVGRSEVGGVGQVDMDVEERLCCWFYLRERSRGPGRSVLAYDDEVWVGPGERREGGESGHWMRIWVVGFLRILTTEILLSLRDVMAREIHIFRVGNVDKNEEGKAFISRIFDLPNKTKQLDFAKKW